MKKNRYTDATWERADDLRDDEKIMEYYRFNQPPPPTPKVHNRNFFKFDQSPLFKNDNTLRPYQLEGLNWLAFNWAASKSSILADEMVIISEIQNYSMFIIFFFFLVGSWKNCSSD